MAKKQHGTAPPNPHSIPNRDIIQRLNFLYQASTYLSSLAGTKGEAASTTKPKAQTVAPSDPKGKEKRVSEGPIATPAYLSRAYIRSMRAIGQKTVVKLDPSVKRTICRGCHSLLIPGMTAAVRSKPSSSHHRLVRLSCLNCKKMLRIPAPPLSQDDLGSPPDLESATQVDGTRAEGRKRKRSKKAVYKPPFFERPEHILFRGNKMVVKTEDPPQGGMAAQVPSRL